MKSIKKNVIISCVILLLFIVIEVFYVCFVPKIIDINNKKETIQNFIQNKTALSLETKNIELKTYPNFSFSVYSDEISLCDKNKAIILHTNKPFIKINLFNLLLKKIKIDEISAQKIFIDFSPIQEKIFSTQKAETQYNIPFDIDANKAKIEIDGYHFLLKDKYFNRNISLKGNIFDIIPLTRTQSKLTTDGVFSIDNKVSTFNINIISKFLFKRKANIENYSAIGFIENIDLESLAPYLNKYTNYKNAKGKINIIFNSFKNKKKDTTLEIATKIQDLSINKGDFENQIIAEDITTIKIKGIAKNKTINIDEFKITGKDINVFGKGKIHNYQKENPNINIAISASPSSIENIVNLLPSKICNEIDLVKKHGISGIVSGSLKVFGKIPNLKLFGHIESTKVSVLREKEPTHIGEINLKFQDSIINTIVKMETKEKERFYLNGHTNLQNREENCFDIETTDNLNLKLACDILIPISKIFKFSIGPIPSIKVISGTGKAKLNIKGSEPKAKINGFVFVKKAVGYFEGISAKLTNANIKIEFNQENIYFNTQETKAENYPIRIWGNATTTGDLKLNIASQSINSNILKKITITSPILKQQAKAINFIKDIKGNSKIHILLTGHIDRNDFSKDFSKMMNKIKIEGSLYFQKNKITLQDFSTPINSIIGQINFTDKSINGNNIKAKCGNSDILFSVNGLLEENNKFKGSLSIKGNSLYIKDSLKFLLNSNLTKFEKITTNLLSQIKDKHTLDLTAKIQNEKLDLNSIFATIKILNNNSQNKSLSIPTGEIQIQNGNILIKNVQINKDQSKLNMSGQINNFSQQKPDINLFVNGKNISVKTITELSEIFPNQIKQIIQSAKEYSGQLDININATNKGLNGYANFTNLSFRHTQSDIPFLFKELPIKFTNNNISFEKITSQFGRTGKFPAFINLNIKNYMKVPIINGTIAMKPTSIFVERYINTKLSHPIKLIGDIGFSSEINGSIDSLRIKPILKFQKEADISYLTVNLGNTDTVRELKGDIYINPKSITIKNIDCIKYTTANNKKIYPTVMWRLASKCTNYKNIITPISVNFTTYSKQSAKILNFLFKKSMIKDGLLECNLKYTNENNKPKITGTATVNDVEIPTYNLKIKEGKILADKNLINIETLGSLIATNFSINSQIENSLILPIKIKNIEVNASKINLEKFIETINKWSIDAYTNATLSTKVNMDISDILIEKGKLNFERIEYKTCPMEDFNAIFSFNRNADLNIIAKNFKMTGGNLDSEIIYNFKTGKTTGKFIAKGIDSNGAASSFLGLENQISGKLDGEVTIQTEGLEDIQKVKNLNGQILFKVKDGNMQKLGSLEYLLRASNIIYSGLTTLSVNNFIELFKPFKQGNFSNINGHLNIIQGNIQDIEIYSQGKNMSLYILGKYNIEDINADIEVYGRLGKKIDNIFGAIGNLSANTIFSLIPREKEMSIYEQEIQKIPEIEYKNNDVKIFRATVKGNINQNDSATSFKWIN